MRIVNTSKLPDALVRAVVRFAAREREVSKYVQEVRVTPCRGVFQGRCWGRRVLLRVGTETAYPVLQVKDQRLETGPTYDVGDAVEALAALAGHEFQHSRQFMAGKGHSELDAEYALLRTLAAFRERRAEIEGNALVRQATDDGARQVRAAARTAAVPALKLAKLEAKVKEWVAREKRATTIRKKWERRLKRAQKITQAAPAGA